MKDKENEKTRLHRGSNFHIEIFLFIDMRSFFLDFFN